LLALAPAD